MASFSITPDSKIFAEYKEEICEWIKNLGYNPTNVYQTNVYINEAEGKKVEIRRYKTDDEGRAYKTPDKDEVAKHEPVFIDIKELPDFLKEE